MKKKIIGLILLALATISITKNVYASEDVYYTTPSGIELTRAEYMFLTSFYWDGYPDIMTEEQYEEFVELDLMNRDITIKSTEFPSNPFEISPNSTSHSTSAKTLQIGSACSTTCYTSIVATWHVSPNIRSYDVIGAYFYNVSLISHSTTYVYSTNGSVHYNNLITTSEGIGNSVKLPDTGENIIVNMLFTNTPGGTIFGSYQHAMNNTTLLVSQDYNFSLSGLGHVFAFYGNAYDLYDGMIGVDIDV